MALLQMINAVRGKLREERIASISTSDLLTTEIIDLLNDAGSEILEGNDWEFDVRHDGRLWYPSSQSGTQGSFGSLKIPDNSEFISLTFSGDDDPGEVFADAAAIDLAGFRCSGNRLRARIVVTSSTRPETSWIITDVNYVTSVLLLTLSEGINIAASGVYDWTTYANEIVLPTTVKDVLSVRNEEEPLRLEFANREMGFDQYVPRATDSFNVNPDIAIVGGTITSTARSATTAWDSISAEAAVTGPGIMIWPIPSADVQLEYSYRVQHADLVSATDEWTGVPANVLHAIEWKAFQLTQLSGIQPDPEGSRESEREIERRVARQLGSQSRQPNRRRVPRAFGGRGYGHDHRRRRWASQTIPAP